MSTRGVGGCPFDKSVNKTPPFNFPPYPTTQATKLEVEPIRQQFQNERGNGNCILLHANSLSCFCFDSSIFSRNWTSINGLNACFSKNSSLQKPTMECIGLAARNFAALAASNSPSLASTGRRRLRLLCRTGSCQFALRRSSMLVMASAGSESCIAVKEGFADEEDFIKGGGSELLFVQMQQNKTMEMQSKLADQVRLFLAILHTISSLTFLLFSSA